MCESEAIHSSVWLTEAEKALPINQPSMRYPLKYHACDTPWISRHKKTEMQLTYIIPFSWDSVQQTQMMFSASQRHTLEKPYSLGAIVGSVFPLWSLSTVYHGELLFMHKSFTSDYTIRVGLNINANVFVGALGKEEMHKQSRKREKEPFRRIKYSQKLTYSAEVCKKCLISIIVSYLLSCFSE